MKGICETDNIDIELVELIINKGASPNERDSDGNFCINLACENRNLTTELLEVLFKHGSSANSKGKYDRQPLHLICDNYNTKYFFFLILKLILIIVYYLELKWVNIISKILFPIFYFIIFYFKS